MGAAFSKGLSSDLVGGADTICALATAAGAGALAIIRMSGPGVGPVLRAVCPDLSLGSPWRARRVRLLDRDGGVIDDGIGVAFSAPQSYTGEDMAELTVHGAPAVVQLVLGRLQEAGCRPAEPGEFTRRAVANGKMDLIQAEGLARLLDADSAMRLRAARAQLSGELSGELGAVRRQLLRALGRVEGAVDLGEELVFGEGESVHESAQEARSRIAEVLGRVRGWRPMRGRFRVVIAGESNAGKSTVMNGLCGGERSIVANVAGTTRDVVESTVELGGTPVLLVDTAGLRESSDPLEAEGMRRTMAAIAEADLVVEVRSAVSEDGTAVPVPEGCGHMIVRSKVDLAPRGAVPWDGDGEITAVLISQDGMATVRREVEARVAAALGSTESPASLSLRQETALARAAAAVGAVEGAEPELVAEGLREAAREMARVFGEIDGEAVLDEVFSQFCVGK